MASVVVAGDFKNGITFDDGTGNVLQVIEFQHVKPGKGAAFVRVHDVKENLRAIRMTQAILRDGRNG